MKAGIPSIKRMLGLALIAVSVFGVGIGTAVTVLAVQADRKALAEAEAVDASGVFMEMTDRFELLELADPFLLPVDPAGNAAELYWPDEAAESEGCGVPSTPQPFEGMAILFEKWPEQMQAAERCGRIDDMVRAARMPAMDLNTRFGQADSGFELFDDDDVLRAPHGALVSLLARAHARIQRRDYRNAEIDARAAVSAGRQFVWNSPDVPGISYGLMLMTGGLDHLRIIHERLGDSRKSALALMARDSVGEVQKRWQKALDVGRETSTFPKLLRYAVAAAENEGLPLGVRSMMVVFLGYGHVGHFTERLLGPSGSRARALERLERDPALGLALAEARKGLDLSLRERIELATQWSR